MEGICKICKKLFKIYAKDMCNKCYKKNYFKNIYKEEKREKRKEYKRNYNKNNKEIVLRYNRKYREENTKKVSDYQIKYREENKDVIKESKKNWAENNKEKIKERSRKYYQDNKEKINKRFIEKLKNNHLLRLVHNIRNRIRKSIMVMGYTKKSKTTDILGCSFEEFKEYLENKFEDGMSWENHGKWHLDHIKPISLAKTEEEVYELNKYTNFQPLWEFDNLSKGNKW